MEPVSLFGFYQGWELSQPGGRMFRQHLDQRTVFRAENQRAQRFEDRVVRFLSPEAFHALAPSDPQSVIPSSLLMKRIHQCRLADASLTGNENYPALTVQRSLQRVMQFGQSGIPAHHLPCYSCGQVR